MRYVRGLVAVIIITTLVSFIDKENPAIGLKIGDVAPNIKLKTTDDLQIKLSDYKGKLVLLNFWATYDAPSRLNNVAFNHLVSTATNEIKMISVSLDSYHSIYKEAIRQDQINKDYSFWSNQDELAYLNKRYHLNNGFCNYLINDKGVIIAKNINPKSLFSYL